LHKEISIASWMIIQGNESYDPLNIFFTHILGMSCCKYGQQLELSRNQVKVSLGNNFNWIN
jgi:hypothetical protein